MKKVVCLLFSIALLFTMVGCSSNGTATEVEDTNSPIKIVSVSTGHLFSAVEGDDTCKDLDAYDDLFVVFDFESEDSVAFPSTALKQDGSTVFSNYYNDAITLELNGNNYSIFDNNTYPAYDYANCIIRYTGYKYPIEYKAEANTTTRMFALFYVNPEDTKADGKATFTIGTYKTSFNISDIKPISSPDEIMKIENDYENRQIAGQFIWRLDNSHKNIKSIRKYPVYKGTGDSGSDYEHVYETTQSFNSTGLTIGSCPIKENEKFISLPEFNVDTVCDYYPEQADDIKTYIETYNTLLNSLTKIGTSSSTIKEQADYLWNAYEPLLASLGFEPLNY